MYICAPEPARQWDGPPVIYCMFISNPACVEVPLSTSLPLLWRISIIQRVVYVEKRVTLLDACACTCTCTCTCMYMYIWRVCVWVWERLWKVGRWCGAGG